MHKESWKIAGIVALALAVTISILNQLASMPLSVLDTDPSTYIVVPVLMLPLFALFYIKSGIGMKASPKGIGAGMALFAAFIALVAYLRYALYYEFLSFRIDLLLMPLLLAAYISMMFGVRSIPRFKALMLYSIFASPAILFPLFKLNSAFASANTLLVFYMLKAFEHGVSYVAPTFITFGSTSISIGEACAGIGALIAVVMFLVPIAYLYDGKVSRKVYWVSSGFALMLALNIARMAGIGGIWLAYGPQATVSFIHSFAGVLLFYIAVIVMILVMGLYGLHFPSSSKPKARARGAGGDAWKYAAIAIVILLSLAYFYLTYGYRQAAYASPINFENIVTFNANNTAIAKSLYATVNAIGTNGTRVEEIVETAGSPVIMLVSNATYNSTNPLVMAIVPAGVSLLSDFLMNSTLAGTRNFMTSGGSVYNMFRIISNNTAFLVAHTVVPLDLTNRSLTLENTFIVMPQQAGNASASCRYDSAYYYLYNIRNIPMDRQLYGAYCVARHLVTP